MISDLFGFSSGEEFLLRGNKPSLAKAIQAFAAGATNQNVDQWEEALGALYATLPKNPDGLLEASLVRYALHRVIQQRHGWSLKGIEPDGKEWDPSSIGKTFGKWVPAELQLSIQQSLVQGLSLRDFAAFGSLFEDLARQEAVENMRAIYEFLELDLDVPLQDQEVRLVTHTYMNVYLDPTEQYPKNLKDGVERAKQHQESWSGWRQVATWLHALQQNVTGVATAGAGISMNFTMATRLAEEIGSRYAFYDVSECQGLKEILLTMESSDKPGRVRLSEFYKKGMSTDELWQFNEKKEYLRDLGALDESDPQNPSIIIPNYVTSKPQCLPATSTYSVCCRSECEDLLKSLEAQVGVAEASPEQLVPMIESLASSTVVAPRKLSARLTERLQQVADVNGGAVPIHGRLFTQWMHHAYPRECPFPHELGTTTPMGPTEWMAAYGHATVQASEEEMVCHVSGPCAGGSEDPQSPSSPDHHEMDLPWTATEELLTKHRPNRTGMRIVCQGTVVLGMLLALMSACSFGVQALKGGLNGRNGKPKPLLTSQRLFGSV